MNRTIISIFVAAVTFLLISSLSSHAIQAERVTPTSHLPDEIAHDDGVINLHMLATQGDSSKLAVTLWSYDNAESRLNNARNAARARTDKNFTHVGINVDDDKELYLEFLKRDQLADDSLQFHASGSDAEKLMAQLGLSTVYK